MNKGETTCPLLLSARTSSGLNLCQSCVCRHNLCEFICELSLDNFSTIYHFVMENTNKEMFKWYSKKLWKLKWFAEILNLQNTNHVIQNLLIIFLLFLPLCRTNIKSCYARKRQMQNKLTLLKIKPKWRNHKILAFKDTYAAPSHVINITYYCPTF